MVKFGAAVDSRWAGVGQYRIAVTGSCTGDTALCRVIDAAGRDGSNTHAVLVQRGPATLAGIVLAREAAAPPGLPALRLDQPVFDDFPEHADLATPERRRITVQHLLDMTTGRPWDEWSVSYASPANGETRMALASDRDRYLLDLPLAHPPGTQWTYCGGATALLGDLLIARHPGAGRRDAGSRRPRGGR